MNSREFRLGRRVRRFLILWLPTLILGLGVLPTAVAADAGTGELAFRPAPDGGFTFDTGVVRGRLRVGGKSLGLQEVTHAPTGTRLDRSNGLLSHYRVFSTGKRYGTGAWDWPSRAEAVGTDRVRVVWPAAADRGFEMEAVYRWCDARTIEVQTRVRTSAALPAFEIFLASYFSESFTNAALGLAAPAAAGVAPTGRWIAAERDGGDWQMFPRDAASVGLIRDGRWKLEPNPVDWTIRDAFGASALARRGSVAQGLAAVLISRPEDCFAIAMPHQTEGHRSVYFSLIGRDLKPGETAAGRVRLTLVTGDAEAWAGRAAALAAWTRE